MPFIAQIAAALQAPIHALTGSALKGPAVQPLTAAVAAGANFGLRIGEHVVAIFCAEPVKEGVETLSHDWSRADAATLTTAALALIVLALITPRLVAFWRGLERRPAQPAAPQPAQLLLIVSAAAGLGLGLFWLWKRRRRP